ncbi:baculoviral IAP repeat-containing protein 7-A-like [Mercenaria mercenaria]|uniref:baculoviral IAP repeat-containing protein 7-A-like n=1 Tax=Mercenaria mercenaria TaxID=6596 RepID=UPI00234FB47A|nr:baculoviral IAP repeat-containing protein 7-A-like [Mercenaria mercenaria]
MSIQPASPITVFFNIGDGIVECFSCHCRHNITDNEQSLENFHSQTCKHRIQYGQMLQLHESSNTDICFENVNQHDDDDRTDYAHEENRFLSFQTSPFDNINQNRDFARAGFYYKGSGDILKCYYCGGEVRNWEHRMDPWAEHARWYPRCHFLREQKGEAFIEQFRINVLQQVSIRNTEVAEGYQEHAEQGAAAVPDMSPEMSPNSGRVPIQCIVCRRRNPDILFLPCRHLKCCAECAHDLRRCMVCSRRIVEKIPVYLQ